jgi:hypothetical protein
MPAVIETTEVGEDHAQSPQEAPPQGGEARTGFWPTVVQSLRRYSLPRQQRTSSVDRSALRQLASPMAHVAQEHPMLYLMGFCGMHHG